MFKVLFFLLISFCCHADQSNTQVEFKKIDARYFYPVLHGFSNFCVQVFSPQVQEFINLKLLNIKAEKIVFSLCEKNGNFTLKNVLTIKDEYKYFEDVIEKVFINKLNYISPKPLHAMLRDDQIEIEQKGNHKTITVKKLESSALNEIIYLVTSDVINKIFYKKSTGTTTITPAWKKYPWSKGLLVLDKMVIEQREGTQNLKTKISIKYQNLLKMGLVSEIHVSTRQSLINSKLDVKNQDVTRLVDYQIFFDQYELQTTGM